MTVDTRVHTAEELLGLPDDGSRYELVEGELRRMSPAGYGHGFIVARITARLVAYVDAHRLGEVVSGDAGFVLARNPDTVRGPDVAFVRAERTTDTAGFFSGAPDLAIEVISPSDRYTEVHAKTLEYLRAGARAIILVDPETRSVTVHRASGVTQVADALTVEDVVPGWSLPLDEIFR